MLELNELLELEEVIRDVLNDDLERILIELNRTGELETFLRLLGMHDYLGFKENKFISMITTAFKFETDLLAMNTSTIKMVTL